MKTDFNFESAPGALTQPEAASADLRVAAPEGTTALADLEPGREAVVVSVDHPGPIGRRLLDLGLLPGTRVTMLRRAPLGDPSVYELRGYRLCLRKADARHVRVRVDEAP